MTNLNANPSPIYLSKYVPRHAVVATCLIPRCIDDQIDNELQLEILFAFLYSMSISIS